MATKVQLQGGAFQDSEGNVLANGYLLFDLSNDSQVNGNTEVCAGIEIKILLDANGNIQASPVQSIWPNDVLTPTNNYYTVSGYTAAGELAWGPNVQQVLSAPSPFDVGAWIPNQVTNWSPTSGNEAVQHGGTLVGTRPAVNLVDSATVLFTATDNAAQNRVDVTAAITGAGTGTVTSVGLTMPGEFSVSGSPITTTGTLAVSKSNQNANLVFAGPSNGAAAAPIFRSLVGADSPVLDQTVFVLNEDFISNVSTGQNNWGKVSNTNGIVAGAYPHFGVSFVSTSNTSGNFAMLFGNSLGFLGMNANAGWESILVFQAVAATNICVRVGWGLGNDPPPDGMWVRFDTAAGDTKFVFECRASGTSTTALSSINGDAGWHRVRIRSTVAGTILFSVDGETEVSIATNVPSNPVTPLFQVVTRTTASQQINADFFAFKATGLSR